MKYHINYNLYFFIKVIGNMSIFMEFMDRLYIQFYGLYYERSRGRSEAFSAIKFDIDQ